MPRWPTTHTFNPNTLRRYTELPFVLDLLVHKRLALLAPASWIDRNDAHFMSEYQRLRQLKSVLALCFTSATETFHHWRVFSGLASGVCLELHRSTVEKWAEGVSAMQLKSVSYRNLATMRDNRPAIHHLPFLKRFAYRDEREVRLVWESAVDTVATKAFSIELTCIAAIHTSPWLPEAVHDAVRATIATIPGCADLPVRRSLMLDSPAWKRFARSEA